MFDWGVGVREVRRSVRKAEREVQTMTVVWGGEGCETRWVRNPGRLGGWRTVGVREGLRGVAGSIGGGRRKLCCWITLGYGAVCWV